MGLGDRGEAAERYNHYDYQLLMKMLKNGNILPERLAQPK